MILGTKAASIYYKLCTHIARRKRSLPSCRWKKEKKQRNHNVFPALSHYPTVAATYSVINTLLADGDERAEYVDENMTSQAEFCLPIGSKSRKSVCLPKSSPPPPPGPFRGVPLYSNNLVVIFPPSDCLDGKIRPAITWYKAYYSLCHRNKRCGLYRKCLLY